MKKIMTFALASVMTLASSMMVLADAEPIAAITNTYSFEGAKRSEGTVDMYNNPFKDGGNDVVSIQYTVTIPEKPTWLTGYDTVMTFGSSADGMVYVCNELVGANANSAYIDYWPSGTLGTLVYPGAGQTYTVNVVFSSEGVAFYKDGEAQAGSNTPVADTAGNMGTLTGTDLIELLNTEEILYIGDNNTSYWAVQDMILSNIIFFKGDQTTPYTLNGSEAKAVRYGVEEEETTEGKKDSQSESQVGVIENTTAPETTTSADPNQGEEESQMLTVVMVIVVVVVILAIGVSAVVIMGSKRRRR